LGSGTKPYSDIPAPVVGLTGVEKIAADYSKSMAVRTDGTVWSWGGNHGGLGDGTFRPHHSSPVRLESLPASSDVAAEFASGLALSRNGEAWTWGGLPGQANVDIRYGPDRLSGFSGIRAIAPFTFVSDDGSVWNWGGNQFGELGDGTTQFRDTPVRVVGLSGIRFVSKGERHRLAVDSDGRVWAWGQNEHGKLGDGTTVDRNLPVQVPGLTGVVSVYASSSYSLALKSNGTVWTWGLAPQPDGRFSNVLSPSMVGGLWNVIAISGGRNYRAALRRDGTVWVWGGGGWGVLGSGDSWYSFSTPTQRSGLSGIVAIAAGESHVLALRKDGTVLAWGQDWYGQLGRGFSAIQTTPVPVVMGRGQ